eukprot:3724284-Amphidinium_carterae.2
MKMRCKTQKHVHRTGLAMTLQRQNPRLLRTNSLVQIHSARKQQDTAHGDTNAATCVEERRVIFVAAIGVIIMFIADMRMRTTIPCIDKLCGGMEFVCGGCARKRCQLCRNRLPRRRSDRQPEGTVEPREGHQPRRSGKGNDPSRSSPSGEGTEGRLGCLGTDQRAQMSTLVQDGSSWRIKRRKGDVQWKWREECKQIEQKTGGTLNEPEGYEDESSNDSEGTYHSPTPTDQTPELEEDLDWLDEDLEEEEREQEEVRLLPPFAWLAPPVIIERPLPVAVKRLPRPSVVAPQPPAWEEPMAAEVQEEGGEEEEPVTHTTL